MQHDFHMWSEHDLDAIRSHLDLAVSEDCLGIDPQNAHQGRDALEKNVRAFRTHFPTAVVSLASQVDSHHQRHRYAWEIEINGHTLITGMDVTTINNNDLIERVDGFFGDLKPLD